MRRYRHQAATATYRSHSPCLHLPYLKRAEARQDHPIATGQRLLDAVKYGVQGGVPLRLRSAHPSRYSRGHIALSKCRHCARHLLRLVRSVPAPSQGFSTFVACNKVYTNVGAYVKALVNESWALLAPLFGLKAERRFRASRTRSQERRQRNIFRSLGERTSIALWGRVSSHQFLINSPGWHPRQ